MDTFKAHPEDYAAAVADGVADRRAGKPYMGNGLAHRTHPDRNVGLAYTHAWLSLHEGCLCVIASMERGKSVVASTGEPPETAPGRRIRPGVTFSTPFESGCVAQTAPDASGSFDGLDHEGVLCSYVVDMVTEITAEPPGLDANAPTVRKLSQPEGA